MQTEGFSLEGQLEACRYRAQQSGWQVVEHYSDVESARTAERPHFQRMLADAEIGAFDIIIVHKLDRFSRSVTDMLLLLRRLQDLTVELFSVSEQFEFGTAMGQMMLTMLSAFAQWYLDNLSQETAKGKRARASRGLWNSCLPFGYSAVYKKDQGDGLPQPDQVEAAGVRLAFERYATGKYSDSDIARTLNEAGFRPRGRGSRALQLWSKDTIRDLLRNPFYVGEVTYRGKRFDGQHEPIIKPELFELCQQVRSRRRPKYGICAPKASSIYPLSGIARCARCHSRMRGSTSWLRGARRRLYRDPAKDHCLACDQGYVPAQDAEDALGRFLSELSLPEDWKAQVLDMVVEKAGGHRGYERDSIRIKGQLARLKDLYQMGDTTKEQYVLERDRLSAELASLSPPQLPDLERVAALLEDFGAIWAAATDGERKQIVHTLLQTVYLDKASGPVVAIEPRAAYASPFLLAQRTGATGFEPAVFPGHGVCSGRDASPTARSPGPGSPLDQPATPPEPCR